MAETMLKEEIPVYSERNDVHGIIRDYGMVTKLFFSHAGKDIVMGLSRDPFADVKTVAERSRDLIDSYIENLTVAGGDRKLQLHYWHIEGDDTDGGGYLMAHGIVSGHKKLTDGMRIHTSVIRAVCADEKAGEILVTTQNNVYHCPLEYCSFDKQDAYPDIIPDYERLKKAYRGRIRHPSTDPGKVLLVLANFCEYYFHSLYYVPGGSGSKEPAPYMAIPHIGTYQDSFLILTEGGGIDLRYFPHYQNIEFYSMETGDRPLFLENIGDVTIYAKTRCGTIKLDPGDRKEVTEENAEDVSPALPDGDLYPAGIIEE